MLAGVRDIKINGQKIAETPAIIPSFSSKGFPEVRKIIEVLSESIVETGILISAYVYSPELNPDELVNQDVKRNLFRTDKTKTKPELMKKLRGFLWSKQRRPHAVKNYFKGKYVSYAQAA